MKRFNIQLTPQQAAIVSMATAAFMNVPRTVRGREAAQATAEAVFSQCIKDGADGHGRNVFDDAITRFSRDHVVGSNREPDPPKGPPTGGNVVPFK